MLHGHVCNVFVMFHGNALHIHVRYIEVRCQGSITSLIGDSAISVYENMNVEHI